MNPAHTTQLIHLKSAGVEYLDDTYLRLVYCTQFPNSKPWHFAFLPIVLQVPLLHIDGKAELCLSDLVSYAILLQSKHKIKGFFENVKAWKFHFDISTCPISLHLIWK